MKTSTENRAYLAPKMEVAAMNLEFGILTGSENQIAKPDNYQGSGEGFDW